MKREKVTVKFYDGRDDIIIVSDSISIYDTTEGTTIIKSQGYIDRVIPSDNIKSISLEHLQDKTKDTEETLDKLNEILSTANNIWVRLSDITDECNDLTCDITRAINEIEVM